MQNDKQGAAVKFPPPLIFILLMLVAVALEAIAPLELVFSAAVQYLGAAIALFGLVSLYFIKRSFARALTSIEPWKPTSQIITTGFYAHSRNPIYVAFCLLPIGLGLYFSSCWLIVSFVPSLLLVYYLAIVKEEAYLEAKFGQQYRNYKSRVRRWL